MKKLASLLLVLALALSLLAVPTFAAEAQWPSFRGSDTNNGITHAQTPRSAEESELKWAVKHSTGWSDAPSPMIIAEDSLFVMYGNTLKKLSLETGEVLASATMTAATSWGSTPPLYADGKIFCQLGSSTLQAFDTKTLESLWVYTDEISGQAQCPVVYSDGKVYVGFGYNAESPFVCLDAKTGELVWRTLDAKGYYWAGAVVVGDYVIYGTESGTLYSRNKQTGAVVTELKCSETAKVRSTVTYDDGKLYWMLSDATVCRADINAETGALTNLTTKKIGDGLQSTSTVTVYGGIIYTATSGKNVVALDADTLETLWTVEQPAYPQCSILLSDAYISTGYVYLYITYNKTPGGLNVIKAKADGSEAVGSTLFDAADYKNFCICSVIADNEGTLYYKNDTGNVFAVGVLESVKNQNAADSAAALIGAVGDVTLQSADAIEAARAAYDALTAEQKALVANYETLTAAEAKLEKLKDEATAVPVDVYVTISKTGNVVMAEKKVTVSDRNNNGFFDVDDALYAAHEAGFTGGAAAGYASAETQWGLGIAKLWGDTSYAYGYWLNNASCWSLEDVVAAGDRLVAFVYTDGANWSDTYSKFAQSAYTGKTGIALTVKLEKAGYDANYNTVFSAHAGATVTAYDSQMKALTDGYTVTDNGDGTYAITFQTAGSYYVIATDSDPITVPAVCQVTVEKDAVVNGNPSTGDTSHLMAASVLMLVCVLGISAVIAKKKYI